MATDDTRGPVQKVGEGKLSRRTLGKRALATGLVLGAAGSLPRFQNGAASRAAAQETVELSFMHWGSVLEKQVLEGVVKRFQETHPNVKIDQQHVPDEYETKLNTLVAADQLPDLFYMTEGATFEYPATGRVLDMTPYVAQYPQFQNTLPQFFYYFAPGKTLGRMLAPEIPMLFYHRELVEAAGVAPPPADPTQAYTWDQFVETAKLLTLDRSDRNAADPEFDPENIKQFGVSFPTWWVVWYPLVRSNGGNISTEDGMQYVLNSPEAVEVLQGFADLINKHHVAPTPTQMEGLPATAQLLQTRRVAMTLHGQWNLLDISEAKVPFGVGVLPRFKEPRTVVVSAFVGINAKTAHVQEAVEFYLAMNDFEYAAELFAKGLWMPLEEPYYTDPEFIAKWAENDAHPPEYKQAALDYTLKYSEPSAIHHKNWAAINSRLEQGLDQLWSGDKPAQQVLDELQGEIQPLLQGKWPLPPQ